MENKIYKIIYFDGMEKVITKNCYEKVIYALDHPTQKMIDEDMPKIFVEGEFISLLEIINLEVIDPAKPVVYSLFERRNKLAGIISSCKNQEMRSKLQLRFDNMK